MRQRRLELLGEHRLGDRPRLLAHDHHRHPQPHRHVGFPHGHAHHGRTAAPQHRHRQTRRLHQPGDLRHEPVAAGRPAVHERGEHLGHDRRAGRSDHRRPGRLGLPDGPLECRHRGRQTGHRPGQEAGAVGEGRHRQDDHLHRPGGRRGPGAQRPGLQQHPDRRTAGQALTEHAPEGRQDLGAAVEGRRGDDEPGARRRHRAAQPGQRQRAHRQAPARVRHGPCRGRHPQHRLPQGHAPGRRHHQRQALPRARPGDRQHRLQRRSHRRDHRGQRPLPAALPQRGQGGYALRDGVLGDLLQDRPEHAGGLLLGGHAQPAARVAGLQGRDHLRRPRSGRGGQRPHARPAGGRLPQGRRQCRPHGQAERHRPHDVSRTQPYAYGLRAAERGVRQCSAGADRQTERRPPDLLTPPRVRPRSSPRPLSRDCPLRRAYTFR
ncbi:hypothetical protein SBRY_70252 [Actinacidiphila bryophytorum]|uniref:Uncharacterized protein n=1 Tax=Actinacidiphila bryophytorum TaxID=1436133 RepID=A0A9W4H6L5_9ACTN|nr:hypothetical protein SBRY_70252 [Actinacidiphila bryophytorum]